MNSSQKVLITGANGFLGTHLCKRLASEGYAVSAFVRKKNDLSELEALKINFCFGDITDSKSLEDAIKGHSKVFHLAGFIGYKKSDRAMMDLVNVTGTQNVVNASLKIGIDKLLHLSSVVAIGASYEPVSLNEESEYKIGDLNLGYFETKNLAERIVIDAVKNNNLNAVCVNPSTIYGAADAKKGSRKTQLKVAQGKFPFYTSGGVNVVAVEDVLDGIMAATKLGKNGERYLLTSENLTIKELFAQIAKCANVRAPKFKIPDFALHALGEIGDTFGLGISRENAWTATLFHWFDNTKAKKILNFNPQPAHFAIENSVRWMKDSGLIGK